MMTELFTCRFDKHYITYEDGVRACAVCGLEEELIGEEFEAVLILMSKGFKVK